MIFRWQGLSRNRNPLDVSGIGFLYIYIYIQIRIIEVSVCNVKIISFSCSQLFTGYLYLKTCLLKNYLSVCCG